MKQFKKSLLILFIAIFIIMQCFIVKAADATMDVGLSSTTTTVSKGEEVTVMVGISNVNVGDGINTFQATLSYDTDVFTSVDIQGINDWTKQTYNSSKGIFILTYSNMLTSTEQGIAKITFKVKEDTTKTSGKITLSGIEAANPDVKVTPDDTSITIKIGTTNNSNNNTTDNNTTNNNTTNDNTTNNNTTNNNTTNNNTTNNNTNNSGSTNTNNSNSSNVNNQNTSGTNTNTSTSSSSLPKTGIEQWIIVAILAVGIIAVVSYLQYRKYHGIK